MQLYGSPTKFTHDPTSPKTPPPTLAFVILSSVQVLYGVLLLSTMALIWAALAVVRHIRRQRTAARSQAEHHDEPL
jgi:hypothetical protein